MCSLVTTVFILNLSIFIAAIVIDAYITKNKISNKVPIGILDKWIYGTALSIPVWFIYIMA